MALTEVRAAAPTAAATSWGWAVIFGPGIRRMAVLVVSVLPRWSVTTQYTCRPFRASVMVMLYRAVVMLLL